MAIEHTRSRNVSNTDHVFNRARDGRRMFMDDADREYFHDLLVRALVRLDGGAKLISYCLLSTHFHLIIREYLPGAQASLMNGVLSSYVRYFNRRHGTSGPMFKGEYRGVPIRNSRELRWKIAYVHDNHARGLEYRFSTHRYFLCDLASAPKWLDVETGISAFGRIDQYLGYLDRRAVRKDLNKEFFDQ